MNFTIKQLLSAWYRVKHKSVGINIRSQQYLGIYILWYHRIRIVSFILHETLFQKLNLTQNMARLFKEKIAICMACCSKFGQFFESIPTKYTWSVNGLMTNTKFTSLKILLMLVYIGYKNFFSYRYLNTISLKLSLCHPVGSGEN